VSIRSLGWDGQLTIDGITSIPFNFGVQGIVTVGNEPGDAVRTVTLDAKEPIDVVNEKAGKVQGFWSGGH